LLYVMSFATKLKVLQDFFKTPSDAPPVTVVQLINEQMGIQGIGPLPSQVDELIRQTGLQPTCTDDAKETDAKEKQHLEKLSQLGAEFTGIINQLTVDHQLQQQKAKQARNECEQQRQQMQVLQAGLSQKEADRKKELAEKMNEVGRELERVYQSDRLQMEAQKDQEIQKLKQKHEEEKQRDEERLQHQNDIYRQMAEEEKMQKRLLEEEKSQVEADHWVEMGKMSVVNRMYKDAVNDFDKQLHQLKDESDTHLLCKAHLVRQMGIIDLEFMRDVGLREDDQVAATQWQAAFRKETLCEEELGEEEDVLPPFNPLKAFSIYLNPETEKEEYRVNSNDPFVIAFKKRYRLKFKKEKRTVFGAGTVADVLLEYLRSQFAEFMNSERLPEGFEPKLMKCCQIYSCYKEGKCSGVAIRQGKGFTEPTQLWNMPPLSKRQAIATSELQGWRVASDKVEMAPKDRLHFFLDLKGEQQEKAMLTLQKENAALREQLKRLEHRS